MISRNAFGTGVFVFVALGFLGFCLYQLFNGRPMDRSSQPSFETGNPTTERLLALSESDATFVLAESVGQQCTGSESFYMGVDEEHDAFWSVRCTTGNTYMVEIHPDKTGSTRVLDCPTFETVAHLSCFEKLSRH